MKRKILIAGGMGFIGVALVKRFTKNDDVTIVDRLDFGISEELKPLIDQGAIEFIETDLASISSIHNRINESEFDLIVNVAAVTHIPTCKIFPDFAYNSNTLSVLNILNVLPKKTKLINFSTSSTYAPEEKEHTEKKSKLEPIDFYGWTKKHMEDLCNIYAKDKKLQIINIRLANAAGFGETNPKLLGTIFMQIMNNQKKIKLGNLTPKRDFIHVDDIGWVINQLSIVWPVREGEVEVINLGTGHEPVSVSEVFTKINACFDNKFEIEVDEARKRLVDRQLLCVDSTKLFSILPKYKPKKIDDWLPDLAKKPNLRINNNLQKLLDSKYGIFSKKIPTY